MFDQQQIAKDIKKYCRTVFDEDNQTYTDEDIDRGITIFFNLMRKRTSHVLLNGFQNDMEKALTDACIENQGDVLSLLNVAARLDGFFKRMYCFATTRPYNDYKDQTQGWLIPHLPSLPNIRDYNNDAIREGWKGNGSGAYPLARAVIVRNTDVHNAPDWDKATVFDGLRYCLASAILVTLKLESALSANNPDLLENPAQHKGISDEELQAFDFINYSRPTRALRSQIIECFIQRTLFKEGPMDEVTLENKVHEFIGKKTDTTVKQRFARLERQRVIEKLPDARFDLSGQRRLEMAESETSCAANILSFKENLAEILTPTSLNSRVDDVYAQLLDFLKRRYQETTGAAFAVEDYDISDDTNSFLDWIKSEIGDNEGAKNLYRKIIELCRHNGIAYKLSAGRAIAALADSQPEALQAAGMKRYVYLDSQVVLPMLCMAHKDFLPGSLWEFRNALQIKKQGQDGHFNLRFADSYINEIYGHAQQALKLASWTDFPAFGLKDFSRNVFYQHYIHLKQLGKLPEDAVNYPDYLAALFSLEQDDIETECIRGNSKILNSEIDTMIEDDLGIELYTLPYYDVPQIKDSLDIFTQVVRSFHSGKKETATKLDAIMGLYLFEENVTPRSIFVTRDTTFNHYRERMATLYGKRNNYLWHLFSPTRFVVCNELTGMTINNDLLSDDLLMLLDNQEVRDNAKCFMDVNTRLTDIEGLTPAQMRQRMKDNFAFFSKQEIKPGSEEEIEYLNELATDLNSIWDTVRNHFSQTAEQADTFRQTLLDDTKYSELMGLISSYVSRPDRQLPELLNQIHTLVFPPVADQAELPQSSTP